LTDAQEQEIKEECPEQYQIYLKEEKAKEFNL